ncbi:MAG: hypothetical protein CL547_12880 [Alcanivorax sp.]|jgi:glucose-1-phosphate thymidylyltransferase|nr:hypothetical protein [Alcanivorax sp.]|tara:strand:- start:429 stop:707 length:279 start_codon:yes stop_codon:yes gene_type:complete
MCGYLEQGELYTEVFARGFVCLDAGTPESLIVAANMVRTVEQRELPKIACLEEIAWRASWICSEQLMELRGNLKAPDYGQDLVDLLEQEGGQ